MTPRDVEDPTGEHSRVKGVSAGADAGGFEHIADPLGRAMLEIAKTMGWPLDPKARWFYRLAELLPAEQVKEMIVDAATEHVAMLLPCEAVALINALGLEAA